MCSCNKIDLNYSNIYLKPIENQIVDIKNARSDYSEITKFLIGLKLDVPNISPFLLTFLNNDFKKENKITDKKYKKKVEDNIWNFALAKQSNILSNLKKIEKEIKDPAEQMIQKEININTYMNVYQEVEKNHISKNSQIVQDFSDSKINKILEYRSEGDGDVRPEHNKANGHKDFANSKGWTPFFRLLGEWNCRCGIYETNDTKTDKKKGIVFPKKDAEYSASDIDLEEGRVFLFKKELDIFSNVPEVVRRQYRKNGF